MLSQGYSGHYLIFELCLPIGLCFSVFLKEPCLFELICLFRLHFN